MNYCNIKGTGRQLPKKNVNNDELREYVDTNDEWITSRTGIQNRRIAVEESLTDLCVGASVKAMDDAGIHGEDVELIIVATMTPEYATPSTACLVQKEIGAHKAMAFDINAACSGFLFALQTANEFIRNNTFKNALIIGAEKMSRVIDWTDRNTCVLFGDGAGAVVVEQSEEAGILGFDSHSIGEDYECLTAEINRIKTPFGDDDLGNNFIEMDGRTVFGFATRTIPKSIRKVARKYQVRLEEVDCFVLHQANRRIIESIAKRLEEDVNKFYMNMNLYGNTSAASVPIALDELAKEVDLKGKTIILAGFGGGLTYSSAVVKYE